MTNKEELWSQLNTKYGSTDTSSKRSLLSKKNFRMLIGALSVALTANMIYEKYNEIKENDESLFDLLGDTSLEAIASSSAFCFMFVLVLKASSESVIEMSQELRQKTSIPIPTISMPLIVSLISAEAFELVVNKHLLPGAGKFEAGHLTGMLLGILVVSLFESTL